ncbi:MAG: replicative DNA helicase, partial [Chloroflexi bacterium]|nr:replicative DNA helicase [Chloroflexota bacterium]
MLTNDSAVDRLPPNDLAAEQAVIGSILADPDCLTRLQPLIEPEDFFYERHRWIYEAALALFDRQTKIDLVTIARELEDHSRLDDAGGPLYLAHLIAETPTSLHVEYYAGIVKRTALQRRMIAIGGQIVALGYQAGSDLEHAIAQAEELVYSLRVTRDRRGFVHLREVLDELFEQTIAVPESESLGEAVPTGFIDLDRLLGGLKRSDLILLAARPGMGKSSFALNVALNAARQRGATVAICSLEMSSDQLANRLLASESGIDSRRLRLNLLSESEQQRLMETITALAELNIYIDDTPAVRIADLRARVRRLHAEHPIDLLVVDYLQLIHGSGSENRVQEIGEISRSLKGLARELDIPVLALSQLSRAVEQRSPHIPMLSDLRESGSLEQDADVVLFIYREDVYYTEKEWEKRFPTKPYPRGIVDILVAKHRNGPTGQISLLWFE